MSQLLVLNHPSARILAFPRRLALGHMLGLWSDSACLAARFESRKRHAFPSPWLLLQGTSGSHPPQVPIHRRGCWRACGRPLQGINLPSQVYLDSEYGNAGSAAGMPKNSRAVYYTSELQSTCLSCIAHDKNDDDDDDDWGGSFTAHPTSCYSCS